MLFGIDEVRLPSNCVVGGHSNMRGIQQVLVDSFSGMCAGMWLDGMDGQEDEIADVRRGKLDPTSNSEVAIPPNRDQIAAEKASEDEEMIEVDLKTRMPG